MAKKSNGNPDPKKVETIKTKGGGKAQVSKKSVDDAKSNKGAFKERPAYKGKVVKDSKGNMTGIKKNDGTFKSTTGPVARRKAAKELAYDKKLHKADSTSHSKMIKTFQNPIKTKK